MSRDYRTAPAGIVANAVSTFIGTDPRGHRSSTCYRRISTASEIPTITLEGDAYLLAAGHDHHVAMHFGLHPLDHSQVDIGMSIDA
jgi:hypothetical protein